MSIPLIILLTIILLIVGIFFYIKIKLRRILKEFFDTTSLKEAFEKGFRIGASKVQKKHGKWIERESGIEDKENGFETVIVCSCCDFPATTFYSEDCESRTQIRTNFCPNCGAKMDAQGEE